MKFGSLSGAALTILLCLLANAVQAGPREELQRYFDDVRTLTGAFVQRTVAEDGQVMESASGRFAIARPNRFSWHYQTPYEQQIVADGDWLWVYDPDLSQVTARPLQQVLGVGPAMLLSGDYSDLTGDFEVRAGSDGWLILTPHEDRWQFQQLRLRLRHGVPVAIALDSGLGEVTQLELSDLESNVDIPDSRFQFEVPEGVDVIAPPGFKDQQ